MRREIPRQRPMSGRTNSKRKMRVLFITVLFSFNLCLFSACAPNQRIVDSSSEHESTATPARSQESPRVNTVEDEIAAMGTADFRFLYVIRRMDGGPFDAKDKEFLNANTPYEINRRTLADGGRALVIGSNFRFPEANFDALRSRFAFEDHSKSESRKQAANSAGSNR